MPNAVTLVVALASLALWIGLVLAQVPNGWIHLPLALGVTLLVRWIAGHEPEPREQPK
jgi:hypothetical protein